jgi:hypothetical protein
MVVGGTRSQEISKEQAQRFLNKVPEENAFLCNDGSKFRDIKELAEGLVKMLDEDFACHANPETNDFCNWVRDMIKDEKLAKDLASANTKVEAARYISNRVTGLIVLAT